MTFRVVTQATDRALISIEEAREAAGVTGSGQDVALAALALAVSDIIVRECGVVAAGAAPPSLRLESCEEDVRRPRTCSIALSRRFVSVTSVVEDGAPLSDAAYEVDELAGIVTRLDGDRERRWGNRVVVAYDAGFDEAPDDLKRLVRTALREFSAGDSRDPLLRSESVEGISRQDFQVGGSGRDSGSILPPGIAGALGPYMTVSVG